MRRRHETPRKRVYPPKAPGGRPRVVWIARYTDLDGKHRIAKPDWNGGKGTFEKRADAQTAIDEAYDAMHAKPSSPSGVTTVGEYAATWAERHPRSDRTNRTNNQRIGRMLGVEIEGRRLRDWPYIELRPKHVNVLIDHMLRVNGRTATGAGGVLRALSAMTKDAITDEVAEVNVFLGKKVRASDPRIQSTRPRVRVWQFDQMHAMAREAGSYEPMIRVLADCGLRLGELLPLERRDFDGESLTVRRTAFEGRVLDGTKVDHGEPDAGRVVPVPPSTAELIQSMPPRIDTPLLFPTPGGKLWRNRNFYRDVWHPAREAWAEKQLAAKGIDLPAPVPEGLNLRQNAKAMRERRAQIKALMAEHFLDPRAHEMRHSYVSLLRAAGIDDADLAKYAGHTVETMIGKYTHGLDRSAEAIRRMIG